MSILAGVGVGESSTYKLSTDLNNVALLYVSYASEMSQEAEISHNFIL